MSEETKVLWEELLPDEFIARLNACPVAYLPLGTLEWHGFHLPLGSDGIQPREFFVRLARQVGGVVLPMLFLAPGWRRVDRGEKDYIGMDVISFEETHLQQLEGCAYWAEDELFAQIVEAVLYNLARAGFKVVVAHGHGPSNSYWIENIPALEKKFGLKLLLIEDENGFTEFMTDHAALNETALVAALRPDLVDLSQIAEDARTVGIWGADPRGVDCQAVGDAIIRRSLEFMTRRIANVLAAVHAGKRENAYHHVINQVGKPVE